MGSLLRILFRIFYRGQSNRGFAAALFAFAMAAGVVALFPEGRDTLSKLLHFNATSTESHKDAARQIAAKLQESREQLIDLQNEYSQVNADATRQYQALAASRKSLNTSDQAAVHKFNEQAAAYQLLNTRLKHLAAQISEANQTVDSLLDERSKQSNQAIVMYTTSACPYCKAAKTYFAQKGVSYREVDIEASPENYNEFKNLGGKGVPLIIVGDEKMEGFNPQKLDSLL